MISDMKSAHLGPCQLVCREQDEMQIPEDIYYAVSAGADIGNMPQNSLMTVTGVEAANTPARKAFMQAWRLLRGCWQRSLANCAWCIDGIYTAK